MVDAFKVALAIEGLDLDPLGCLDDEVARVTSSQLPSCKLDPIIVKGPILGHGG